MNDKKFISVGEPHRLLTPGLTLLISTGNEQDDNLFSVAWNMPVRKQPPMVAILCGKRHYSFKLLEKTGEFGINIPDHNLIDEVIGCGKTSGKDITDKFDKFNLTRKKAKIIKAPLVLEAIANLECRIFDIRDMGTSALITAQVLNAVVDEKHFKNNQWIFENGLQLIHHLGGLDFCISNKKIKSTYKS